MKKNSLILIAFFIIILLLSIIVSANIGVVDIPFKTVLQILLSKTGLTSTIDIPQNIILTITKLRLPRIFMSLLCGASLALCGAVFQSIFRNPICDPYVLGISSGASLGASIAFILGLQTFFFGVTLPALITALATLGIILGISKFSKQYSIQTILLTGIAINFLISAVITLLIVLNQQEMHKIIFWTMGSFSTVSYHEILLFIPVFCVTVLFLFYYSKDLNIMQLGNDVARTLGVHTVRVTMLSLFFSSLLVAAAVSICGAIGFIGLITPHIVRRLWGNKTISLFTYSLFFGAFFMLIADTLARTIAPNSELPVGSITALIGAPFFIYLLIHGKSRKLNQ